MFFVGQIKCSWLIPREQAICFSSLIWLSRNKSVKKSRFSRIVKISREFSLLDLEAFWFHFSLLEKEWKHFIFTLHFSKKSESFLFSLLELQKPTPAGPCLVGASTLLTPSLPCIPWLQCIPCVPSLPMSCIPSLPLPCKLCLPFCAKYTMCTKQSKFSKSDLGGFGVCTKLIWGQCPLNARLVQPPEQGLRLSAEELGK